MDAASVHESLAGHLSFVHCNFLKLVSSGPWLTVAIVFLSVVLFVLSAWCTWRIIYCTKRKELCIRGYVLEPNATASCYQTLCSYSVVIVVLRQRKHSSGRINRKDGTACC